MSRIKVNFWITAFLLVLTISASKLTERRSVDSLAAPLESIPQTIDGWSLSKTETLNARTLQVLTPTSYISRVYEKDHLELQLFVAYYAVQRAGENMHSPKNCLPGSGWDIWRQESAMIPVGTSAVKVNRYSIQNSGQRMLMFYWYQSGQRIIANEYLGKILLVRDALVDGHTAGSIVRLSLPDLPASNEAGMKFASSLIPEVQRCFGR